jgi:hypothetical protein
MNKDITSIQKLLNNDLKDNDHYTEHPMFCLQIKRRDSGYDTSLSDNRCWYNYDLSEIVYDDDSVETKDDLNFDEDSSEWEGPYGYIDRWETVMIAFTQNGIDDYMKADGHNVKRRAFRGNTRSYVESFHRCQEMINIRQFLLNFDSTTK